MSRLRENAQQLISRITEIWLSLLSWMRWRQRRVAREETLRLRQLEEMEVLLRRQEIKARDREERLLSLSEISLRALLMEAMLPLADALRRQDQMHLAQYTELQELLLEVLNSLQPTAEEQISQQIGQHLQTISSPSLAS